MRHLRFLYKKLFSRNYEGETVIGGWDKIRGFSLIELSILTIVLGSIATVTVVNYTSGEKIAVHKSSVSDLRTLKQAIVNYAKSNKFYPCPADPTLREDSIDHGKAIRDTNGFCDTSSGVEAVDLDDESSFGSEYVDIPAIDFAVGTIPCKTLGLDKDCMYDEKGNKYQYIVSYVLTKPDQCVKYLQDSTGNPNNPTILELLYRLKILKFYDPNSSDSALAQYNNNTNRYNSDLTQEPHFVLAYFNEVGAYNQEGSVIQPIQVGSSYVNDNAYKALNHDIHTGRDELYFVPDRPIDTPDSNLANSQNSTIFDHIILFGRTDYVDTKICAACRNCNNSYADKIIKVDVLNQCSDLFVAGGGGDDCYCEQDSDCDTSNGECCNTGTGICSVSACSSCYGSGNAVEIAYKSDDNPTDELVEVFVNNSLAFTFNNGINQSNYFRVTESDAINKSYSIKVTDLVGDGIGDGVATNDFADTRKVAVSIRTGLNSYNDTTYSLSNHSSSTSNVECQWQVDFDIDSNCRFINANENFIGCESCTQVNEANDCPVDKHCCNGQCVDNAIDCTVCSLDTDCPNGQVCESGTCTEDNGGSTTCNVYVSRNRMNTGSFHWSIEDSATGSIIDSDNFSANDDFHSGYNPIGALTANKDYKFTLNNNTGTGMDLGASWYATVGDANSTPSTLMAKKEDTQPFTQCTKTIRFNESCEEDVANTMMICDGVSGGDFDCLALGYDGPSNGATEENECYYDCTQYTGYIYPNRGTSPTSNYDDDRDAGDGNTFVYQTEINSDGTAWDESYYCRFDCANFSEGTSYGSVTYSGGGLVSDVDTCTFDCGDLDDSCTAKTVNNEEDCSCIDTTCPFYVHYNMDRDAHQYNWYITNTDTNPTTLIDSRSFSASDDHDSGFDALNTNLTPGVNYQFRITDSGDDGFDNYSDHLMASPSNSATTSLAVARKEGTESFSECTKPFTLNPDCTENVSDTNMSCSAIGCTSDSDCGYDEECCNGTCQNSVDSCFCEYNENCPDSEICNHEGECGENSGGATPVPEPGICEGDYFTQDCADCPRYEAPSSGCTTCRYLGYKNNSNGDYVHAFFYTNGDPQSWGGGGLYSNPDSSSYYWNFVLATAPENTNWSASSHCNNIGLSSDDNGSVREFKCISNNQISSWVEHEDYCCGNDIKYGPVPGCF